MKTIVLTFLFSALFLSAFAQDLSFSVRGKYDRPITKASLDKSVLISDFIDSYPSNWISDYISVEITGINDGKTQTAMGENTFLSSAQKSILSKTDLATDIVINVLYKSKNSITNAGENKKMTVKMTVIPEIEAQYIGDTGQQKQYFRDNLLNKIPATTPEKTPKGKVIFTINEAGEVENSLITTSTGDAKIDELMLDSINKMPHWKPAEDSKGNKVKQIFVFSIGNEGC